MKLERKAAQSILIGGAFVNEVLVSTAMLMGLIALIVGLATFTPIAFLMTATKERLIHIASED